ncbi:LysR family transcriptional regulator [Tsukamurella tyrosinosolvens]|uniref:LysR family transcriptional regulator n=1 Tax=Tsukamurella tyrosinosolvens TaxID=57704 RepID=UPI000C7F6D49|nr:LysR family transcriptional regulator [Tsukamurella tyrosinosolvens]AUN41874.1 LysR family transcriptional regulator [Tsukamurella tyrosinosolvens]
MFTLNQLESFVAVAETLHYGHAADRLSITQPPLSRRIQQLERELGVELFGRAGRGITLTPAGSAFLSDARRILGLTEQATLSVRRVPTGQAGTVTLGFTGATAHSILEPIIKATRTHFSDIDLVLRERVSSIQIDELHTTDLDLAIVRPPVPPAGLTSTALQTEELLLALPSGHDLATGHGHVDIRDLDGQALIMYSPTEARYFYDLLAALFRAHHVAPRYVQHISQVHTILALVGAGIGAAIVPHSATALNIEGVHLTRLTGAERHPAELVLAWRSDTLTPAAATIRQLIEDTAGTTQRHR